MVEVYIDGASAGDPGWSGAGIFINYKNGQVEHHAVPLGPMSNHEAEYEALIYALEICLEKKINMVSFRTDSKLIDDAIEKRYVKNKKYQPYLEEAVKMIDQLDLFFMKWIPSNQNKTADALARQAIRKNK
ncbi:reverse transcriptase-like protein [Halalkalibacter krulwichiae]|uniref:14.7 kDa ribonuclease H-like protein n=1 Tax=Halalkalibacter krulwichiae TaxID=199441 RepID=A0A1X9MFW3_9BACI|nr:reverse transcriptase-like protein [Halalkalibacter krulwichiae]ARK30411.1 14.7 kDa ribonuclease H-like protein [Halalkalibacter krulwichiae]